MTKRTIKSYSVKSLAIFLSVLMIFYLIPATAYASLFEATGAESVVSETSEHAGEIFEDVSRREENVKHFRLEDGTYMAAQYDTAVHTLDENGEWQDIDNTLSESGGEYSTSNARIKFAKKITGNESIFTLHESNHKITLLLNGAIKKTTGVAINTATEFDETATTLQKMMTLDKLSSRIIYEDILDGVDLEYIVVSNNVKENIIVKEQKDAYSYSFTLKLNNLSASLSSAGDVEITDPDSGEVLYIIPAPVVYDANMTYASETDAYYTLETIGQNEYRLTVSADTSWMNASERAFPVTIDPAIYHGGYGMQQMCDTCVSQNYPTSVYGSRAYLKVGYDSANANLKAYVAMRSLPTLPAGSMITDAKLNLTYNGSHDGNLSVNPLTLVAKKIIRNGYTSLWTESSTNYNTAMTYGDIMDYIYIKDTPAAGSVVSWNITPAVLDWYNNSSANQGIAIMRYTEEALDTSVHTVQFHSSDSSMSDSYTPFFTIAYVNTIGIESHYSYQSSSIGLAGTGYVNAATGSLSLVNPLLATTDHLLPYTVSIIYNSDFAGKDYKYPNAQTAYSSSYMPYGFKLNINETIIEKRFTNSSAGQSTYYVWADSDGTEHVFLPIDDSTTKYQDEDGLQLTLEISSSTCTIKNDSDTIKTFSRMPSTPSSDVYSAWYLTSITDKNNNTLSFTFDNLRPTSVNLTPNGSEPISFLTLSYNTDGHLFVIQNHTSKEAILLRYSSTYGGSIVTSETKYLKEIVFCRDNLENGKATYTYNSAGLLTRVDDMSLGYRVDYTYSNKKVISIQEYGSSPIQTNTLTYSPGQKIEYTYGVYNTVIQTSGADDTYGTSDDLLTTYCFDTLGRTINCYTTDLTRTKIFGATSGQYVGEENKKAKNSLKTSVQTSYTASNYLLNGSFEEVLNYNNWSTTGNISIIGGGHSHSGNGSLRMRIDSITTSASISQNVLLDSGDYSLSLYVVSDSAINCEMKMTVKNSNSVVVASKNIALSGGYSTGNFALSELSFTVNSAQVETYSVTIELTGTPSTYVVIFLDDIMLSKSLGATECDLIQNGNFELTASGNHIGTFWSIATDNTNFDAVNAESNTPFGRVMKIQGSVGRTNIVLQNIYQINEDNKNDFNEDPSQFREEQKLFTLSGWAKGTAQCYSESNTFAIGIEILYYDGSDITQRDFQRFDFSKNITDWQFASIGISTDPNKGIIESINIYLYYSGHPGTVYFDGITLVQNSTTSNAFEYNINGDLSLYQNGANKTWYGYENNNVTVSVSTNGNIIEYTYDSLNRVRSEQHSRCTTRIYSPNNLNINDIIALYTYYYEYDIYGKQTYSRVTDLSRPGIYSDALTIYNTTSGSHIFGSVSEEIDTLGKVTKYFYDEQNGQLMAIIYPNKEGLYYHYDNLGRVDNITPAYINSESDESYYIRSNAESVTYNYYDNINQLENIITATTTYTFIPDAFGNNTQIQVGDYELASYEHNPKNGKLNKLTYGNGHIVEYSYDSLDRISEIKYNINGDENCITVYSYTYNSHGHLYSIEDHINNQVTVFNYDSAGNLMSSHLYDSETYVKQLDIAAYYDNQSRVSLVLQSFDMTSSVGSFTDMLGYSYEYDTDTNYISNFDILGNYITLSVTPTYDNLGKTEKREIFAEVGSNLAFHSEIFYTYETSNQNESNLVSQYASRVELSNAGMTTTVYNYTYDDNGNITEIRDSDNEILYKYTYDHLGQLKREDNRPLGFTYVYEYDKAGNIDSKTIYYFTVEDLPESSLSIVDYSYSNASWGDLLLNYNGTAITYDAIGNPSTIGSSVLTWQGRRLISLSNDSSSSICYSYNSDGIRTYKQVNSSGTITKHEYLLNGSQILKETVYVNSVESYTLVYLYDETGSPIGIKYRTPSYSANSFEVFFFEKNLQGDIVAIYNADGEKIGTYTYDAWGNFITVVSNNTSILERLIVEEYNPYHYRSYYFDGETGWYYLQSRYYNPEWGRFINADAYINSNNDIIGYNLFAYCSNNPVNNTDPFGTWSWRTVGYIAAGLACAAIVAGFIACTGGAIIGLLGATDAVVKIAVASIFAAGMVAAGTEITYQVISNQADDFGIEELATISGETREASLKEAFDSITGWDVFETIDKLSPVTDIVDIYFEEKNRVPDTCWTDDNVIYNTQERILGEYIPKKKINDIYDKIADIMLKKLKESLNIIN